jgi:uncharacterized repeat protein (TIGR03803 family)
LIPGSDGNFYGMTIGGGTNDAGTVFKMTPDDTESVLYSFKGYPSDFAYAASGLFQADAGSFYGTTEFGGPENKGTIFKISPSGIETVLYSFGSLANDPAGGFSPLVEDNAGNFYGVAGFGGTGNEGAVFKITAEGNNVTRGSAGDAVEVAIAAFDQVANRVCAIAHIITVEHLGRPTARSTTS